MSGYSIVSVRKTTPPQGQTGNDWYCYVLASAGNTIVGYRRGTLGEAKAVAEDCLVHLNRQLGGLPRHDFVRRAYPVADVESLSAV